MDSSPSGSDALSLPTSIDGVAPRYAETTRELRRILCELLQEPRPSEIDLTSELGRLAGEHDNRVYSELIHLMSHLQFDPEEARRHWNGITERHREIERRLGTWVDPRVALMDYFTVIEPRLSNPKIIETSLFERTCEAASRDGLTGLYNFRFFREHLSLEIARARRDGAPVSLLMIDVDDFKPFNDRHGHDGGNEALSALARALRGAIRREDVSARFGGEEFVVVLPRTVKTAAFNVGERIRLRIADDGGSRDELPEGLTVSIGVATFPADADSDNELLRRADQALYTAKARGKNLCHLYGDSRRSHTRIDVKLSGRFRALSAESCELETVKIGQGGMLFVARETPPAEGSLIEIELTLPESGRPARMPARVVSVKTRDDGNHEVAVTTTDIGAEDRRLLTDLLGLSRR